MLVAADSKGDSMALPRTEVVRGLTDELARFRE
ncbi:MAG: hypothetical protein QOF97_3379, partial [Acidimicrobiaceae bacterium]